MKKAKKRGPQAPVTLAGYRQLVFNLGTELMEGYTDIKDASKRLIELAERPIIQDQELSPASHEEEKPAGCMVCKKCGLSGRELACMMEEPYFSLTEDHTGECPSFKSRYIQYPIQVSEIDLGGDWAETLGDELVLVKVRPAGEKKTYLGFFLGNLALSASASYHEKTGKLTVYPFNNPAIFVPSLGRIIFGCESWWSRIKSEKDFKDITDQDIQNTWYVKAWQKMTQKKKK